MVDYREGYDGEKMIIKLNDKQILQLQNDRILEGFNTKIGKEIQ